MARTNDVDRIAESMIKAVAREAYRQIESDHGGRQIECSFSGSLRKYEEMVAANLEMALDEAYDMAIMDIISKSRPCKDCGEARDVHDENPGVCIFAA